MTTNNKRMVSIDFAKCLGIFLVILGHSIEYFYAYNMQYGGGKNQLDMFIYAFHMPLFMTISGMFVASSLKLSFVRMLRKKIVQLLLPSLSFAVLFLFFLYVARLMGYLDLLPTTFPSFWFIICLFKCYLVFWLSMKLFRNDGVACVISCIAVVLMPWMHIHYFNFLYPFLWVGYFLGKNLSLLKKHGKAIFFVCATLFALLFIFWWDRQYEIYYSNITLYSYHGGGNIAFIGWNSSFQTLKVMALRFLLGLSGSFCVLCICSSLSDKFSDSKWLNSIAKFGAYTLVFYIINDLLMRVWDIYGYKFDCNILLFSLVIAPVVSLTQMGIYYMISKNIEKSKILSLLFLGKI